MKIILKLTFDWCQNTSFCWFKTNSAQQNLNKKSKTNKKNITIPKRFSTKINPKTLALLKHTILNVFLDVNKLFTQISNKQILLNCIQRIWTQILMNIKAVIVISTTLFDLYYVSIYLWGNCGYVNVCGYNYMFSEYSLWINMLCFI